MRLRREPGSGQTAQPSPSLLTGTQVREREKKCMYTFLFSFLDQPGGGVTQNCMRMRQVDGKWDDVVCDGTATKSFVCKKK